MANKPQPVPTLYQTLEYVQHKRLCALRWPDSKSMCKPPCEAFICPHIRDFPKPCDCGLEALLTQLEPRFGAFVKTIREQLAATRGLML